MYMAFRRVKAEVAAAIAIADALITRFCGGTRPRIKRYTRHGVHVYRSIPLVNIVVDRNVPKSALGLVREFASSRSLPSIPVKDGFGAGTFTAVVGLATAPYLNIDEAKMCLGVEPYRAVVGVELTPELEKGEEAFLTILDHLLESVNGKRVEELFSRLIEPKQRVSFILASWHTIVGVAVLCRTLGNLYGGEFTTYLVQESRDKETLEIVKRIVRSAVEIVSGTVGGWTVTELYDAVVKKRRQAEVAFKIVYGFSRRSPRNIQLARLYSQVTEGFKKLVEEFSRVEVEERNRLGELIKNVCRILNYGVDVIVWSAERKDKWDGGICDYDVVYEDTGSPATIVPGEIEYTIRGAWSRSSGSEVLLDVKVHGYSIGLYRVAPRTGYPRAEVR